MKDKNETAGLVKKIKSCLGRYGMRKIPFAFLFGSYAEGKQTPFSDIDVAIFFSKMPESDKTNLEHQLSLLFDEQVNVLRFEDDDISPLIKREALGGIPVILHDEDFLARFKLSILHRAEETKRLLRRLRKVA